MPEDFICRQWGTEPAVSAQDELSSCVWVGGMVPFSGMIQFGGVVPFLPAAGVTQMSGIRASVKGQGGQEERGCDL